MLGWDLRQLQFNAQCSKSKRKIFWVGLHAVQDTNPLSTVDFDVRPFGIVPLQEIIKKDEDIGALRASLKRANDEAAKREDDIAAVRAEAEALRKELAAAAEGAREAVVESILKSYYRVTHQDG